MPTHVALLHSVEPNDATFVQVKRRVHRRHSALKAEHLDSGPVSPSLCHKKHKRILSQWQTGCFTQSLCLWASACACAWTSLFVVLAVCLMLTFCAEREAGRLHPLSLLKIRTQYVLISLLLWSHFLKDNTLFIYFTLTSTPCCQKTQYGEVILIVPTVTSHCCYASSVF